jgi:hypothetical protein
VWTEIRRSSAFTGSSSTRADASLSVRSAFNERELDDADLVENAELKGASPLMDFAGPGTVTFTY